MNTLEMLKNEFAKDMNELKLPPEKAIELAVTAASSCEKPADIALAIREVYMLITRGHSIINLDK